MNIMCKVIFTVINNNEKHKFLACKSFKICIFHILAQWFKKNGQETWFISKDNMRLRLIKSH